MPFASKRRPDSLELEVLRISETPQHEKQYKETPSKRKRTTIISDKTQLTDNTLQPLQGDHDCYKQQTTSSAAKSPQQQRWYQLGNKLFRRRSSLAGVHTKRSYDEISDCSTARVEVTAKATLAKPEATVLGNSTTTILTTSPTPDVATSDAHVPDVVTALPRTNSKKRRRSKTHSGDNLFSLATINQSGEVQLHNPVGSPQSSLPCDTDTSISAIKSLPLHDQVLLTTSEQTPKPLIRSNVSDNEVAVPLVKPGVKVSFISFLNQLTQWKTNNCQRNHKHPYQATVNEIVGDEEHFNAAASTSLEARKSIKFSTDFQQLPALYDIKNERLPSLANVKEKGMRRLSQIRRRRSSFYYSDNERRIRANDREFNDQFKYADNFIKTSKYTMITFLPLNLLEQFQRLANFYFLCLLVLQLIPAISSLTPVTTAIPLIGVLTLTAVKDAYDDIQRHVSDSQVNNRKSKALRNGELVEEKWSDVQVGDVIHLENNQFVAADILLLSTSEPNGLCFIETAELDGETNLKCKQCLPETNALGQEHDLLWNFNGEIICEKPNNLLNKFEGTLIWHNKRYALDNEKVLLRGCVLRNTQWCYGMVIFAGKDTKLMQNSGKTQFKSTGVDRLLNFIIIGIVLFLLSICAFFTIACALWESLIGQYFQMYLPWENIIPKHVAQGATVIGLLVFFSYAIVLNTVVPISLYVSVEVIRFVQSFLINWDEEMYYEPSKTHAKARTTTLNEELGQIQYIFSDKTGTLTQNIMTFNKCSINGRTYGDDGDIESSAIIDMEEDRKHNLVFQPSNSTTTTNKTTKTTTTIPFNKQQLNTTNITGNVMLHKADVHEMKSVRMSSNLSKAINSLDSESGSTNTTLLTPSIEKLNDLYKKPSILNTSANLNINPILISTPITRHSDSHAMPSTAKVKRVSYAKSRHSPIGETIDDDGMEMFCVPSATSTLWNETTKVMTLNDVANNPKMSLSDISPNQYQSSSILNTATRTRTANRQQGLEYKNASLLHTAVAVSTIKPSTALFSDKSTIVTHLHNSSKTDQSKSSASTLCTRFCCFCAGNRNDPSFANDGNFNQNSPCCLSELEKNKFLLLPSTTTSAAISNTSSTHLYTNNISDNCTRTHNYSTATDSTTTIIKPICATATFSTIADEKSYYERVHTVEPVDFSTNPEYEQDFRWYDQTLWDAVRSEESHSHNFFRLLALCHTVMPEYKNGRLEYQAQSPDEAALVSAARNFGFVFRSRTPNTITIEVMGRREDYTLLHILDFNNVRKRMSVLLRKGDDIILYCKGADNVIYERLSSSQTEIKAQTQDHLNKFAGEGLRTLVLAERHLTLDFYDQWSRRHHEASTSLINREEKLNALYEEVESDLLLLGVTAIEDKLQDGVADTIRHLQMAGIKIWVLTGDKQETAINIGYSCQLLTDDLADVFIVDGGTMEEVVKQLKQFKESIRIVKRFKPSVVARPSVNVNGTDVSETPTSGLAPSISVVTFRWADDDSNTRNRGEPDSAETNELYDNLERAGGETKKPSVDLNLEEEDQADFALVVNGHSLVHCLTPQLETRFLDIASHCKAVICCRVTPLQKALVVELIKRAKSAVTLAIGDGANDVSMIKAAHIGVGISGQEGLQAVLASDYSIAQFRYLERLLLVHGRWSYYRICKFLRFFFYKNFAFTLCHCWYSMFCGFSAQTVFDPMFISVYNLFYTSLPVLALGVFEQDVSDKHSLAFPKLYAPGLRSQLFNIREFVYSVLHGAFSSLILFLIPYGTYHKGVSPDGLILSDQMTLGAVVATILIIDNTAQIALYTSYWTVFNHITIWGSLIWYFVLDYFYNYVIGGPYVGALSMAMRDLTFWTTMLITVVVIMIPVLAYKFYLIDKHPSLADKVRMMRRMANLKLRQTSTVRVSSSRRSGRSLRSGYAFAHQEGFGRLITSGKIMRKLEQDFAFPLGLGSKKGPNNVNNQPQDNRSNNNNTTRDSNKNASNSEVDNHIGDGLNAFTKPSIDGKIGPRAPCQGLDTIHL